MMPKVLHSSDRVFVTACPPKRWRLLGSPGSWWFGFDVDTGHAPFPAREARDPSVYLRVCGIEITVWP